MFKKISVIVFLLILSLSLQVAADSARIGTSVTIIEPVQKLETRRAISFESDLANTDINADQSIMEIENAGETVISSNLPWEIYAEVPKLSGAEVYVKSNLSQNWVKVEENKPVLKNRSLDRANLAWDIKVVADTGVKIKPFELAFKIAWPRN